MNPKELKNEIFNTLRIKPHETFTLNPGPSGKYYLDENLTLFRYNTNSKIWEISLTFNISHLICGNILIETKRTFTEDEITILKYYKNILKCDYMARDENNYLYAYTFLPYKGINMWHHDGESYELPHGIYTHFPWIAWEDEQPFKIPSFSEDDSSPIEK